MATKKVEAVLNGFRNLTVTEKKEFTDLLIDELENVRKGLQKRSSLNDINLGPIPGGCPCCGRK